MSNPVSPFQRIQTIGASDPDEPLGGHRFFFSLAQEAASKANFSVRDNKGNGRLASAAQRCSVTFGCLNKTLFQSCSCISRVVAVTGYAVISRQHGVDPNAAERLQQPPEERLPRPRGHFGRRLPHAEQHQHADRQGLLVRPRGQHEAVQRRGTNGAGGPQHRRPGGHLALRHHPAQ